MKVLLLLLTACLCLSAAAQKNFEGTIVYRFLDTEEKNGKMELTATFGKNAVLLKMNENADSDIEKNQTEEILVRLDSGKVYNIDYTHRTFRVRRMQLIPKKESAIPAEKIIAGIKTKPLLISEPGSHAYNSFFRSSNVVLYVSDELLFTIPDEYYAVPELMLVSGGKIVLGATITSNAFSGYDNDDDTLDMVKPPEKVVILEAKEIKWLAVPESELSVPVGFQRSRYNDIIAVDSVNMTQVDTVAVQSPPVPAKPAKPAKPKSPKPSSKNTPARKPE